MTYCKGLWSLLVGLSLMVGGCAQTSYVAYDADPQEKDQSIAYRVDRDYYRDLPDCVIVMPVVDAHSRLIERTLARHLRDKIVRVIAPDERAQAVRSLALDLNQRQDIRLLARQKRCGYVVTAKTIGGQGANALFWAEARMGLDVRLIRSADDSILWQARHIARRSDGGVPLSPVSAVFNAYAANRLTQDQDLPPSLADDVVRRMVETLPDTRTIPHANF